MMVNIRDTWVRYVMLVAACIPQFSKYYIYDNPAPLQSFLTGHDFNMRDVEFQYLYSFYSIPNIVLPLFGGILIGKIGARSSLVLFSIFNFTGAFVFALGARTEDLWVMVAGRFIFGLGGENVSVAVYLILST